MFETESMLQYNPQFTTLPGFWCEARCKTGEAAELKINVVLVLCIMRLGLCEMVFLGSVTSVYTDICTVS